jgi:DNA-binding XRE family transcriptional regulator
MSRGTYEFAWGRLIHALRCRTPFVSQATLSEQIGVTQSTLSRIERGDVSPDLFVARSIVRALGLQLDVLDKNIEEAWSLVPPIESECMERAALDGAIGQVVCRRWGHA